MIEKKIFTFAAIQYPKGSFTSFMLSRRHLRIKVMQAVYASSQSGQADIVTGEKELLRSIEKLYELFIYQLTFIHEIFDFAEKRTEDAKQKFLPTDEDLNPNTRFIDNRLISAISNNAEYKLNSSRYRISWHDEIDLVRNIFNKFRESDVYRDYMSTEKSSFKLDRDIVLDLFKSFIVPYPNFESFCEEKNIYWADDYPVVAGYLIKSLKGIDSDWNSISPIPRFRNETETKEDQHFAKQLFRKTLLKGHNYEQMISDNAKNWELERIALMDIILLKMALTEFVEFPTIPIKVSFNEYIEISKEYSTPKSRTFINGILDKLIVDLTEQKKIKKTGRGLVE